MRSVIYSIVLLAAFKYFLFDFFMSKIDFTSSAQATAVICAALLGFVIALFKIK
jgi:ABC-type amino acid transport system permease subunit